MSEVVAKISDLKVHYPIRSGWFAPKQTLKAVDGATLEIKKGEILGLVGESGSGKSSLGRAIIRLVEPTSGKVELEGKNFLELGGSALRAQRTRVQMVFQDPYASLNPRMTIYDILAEPLIVHRSLSSAEIEKRIRKELDRVGLPFKSAHKYPHEFSGGQRQRVAIARALILDPALIIADEPVSSLDVSVQAQILNLLKQIRDELHLSMLFISHNLAVVRYISNRVAVMYLGRIVELGDASQVCTEPLHPYTKALLSAVPFPDPMLEQKRRRVILTGEIPSPINPPSGCAFVNRCPIAVDRCSKECPRLDDKGSNHRAACFEV